MEITGCSAEAAKHAIEAAGPGGVELAIDLVLSTMSTPGFELPAPGGADSSAQPAKLVCLVRQDLGMSMGKTAAQVAHAALAADHAAVVRVSQGSSTAVLEAWREGGEAIIVLAVADLAQLESLQAQADARGLPTERVCDAGRTEVAAGPGAAP